MPFKMSFRCFPDRHPPASSTISYNIRKFRLHGTNLNHNENSSGRKTVQTAENIEGVRIMIQQNPGHSTRRNDADISRSTHSRTRKKR